MYGKKTIDNLLIHMEKAKIVILGSTGMLGSAVSKLFLSDEKYITYCSHRKKDVGDENSFYFDCEDEKSYFETMPKCDYVINCIGAIKPMMVKDIEKGIYLNSIFPRKLSKYCVKNNIKLINISTDCVYSGKKGKYIESDLHDCYDEYGKSKSLGEDVENSMVLRTSIIGEEKYNFYSLLSWIKNQKGKEVNGFTNHYWNGILTDYYGIVCKKIIENNLYENGLFHIFSSVDISKYEIIKLFNEKFDLNIKINPIKEIEKIDRTLRTNKDLCEKLNIPSFGTMVDMFL
jgi:dTDP-4-dehydrorhamnose reductase